MVCVCVYVCTPINKHQKHFFLLGSFIKLLNWSSYGTIETGCRLKHWKKIAFFFFGLFAEGFFLKIFPTGFVCVPTIVWIHITSYYCMYKGGFIQILYAKRVAMGNWVLNRHFFIIAHSWKNIGDPKQSVLKRNQKLFFCLNTAKREKY